MRWCKAMVTCAIFPCITFELPARIAHVTIALVPVGRKFSFHLTVLRVAGRPSIIDSNDYVLTVEHVAFHMCIVLKGN